jgi:hypothetical protein
VTGIVLADVAWWAPIAIIGGAVGGAAVGYLLLVVVGGTPRRSSETSKIDWERTDKTNYPSWNPAAFVVALAAIGLIAGLAVGLSSG